MTRIAGTPAGRRGWRWVAGWLLATGVVLCGADTWATSATTHLRIVGYVLDASPLPHVSPDKLDVVNYAFARLEPGGEVIFPSPTAGGTLAALTGLRKGHPELKVMVSIGGWGADHFSDVALAESSRQRMADSVATLIEQHDVDGVDLDWEYPTLAGAGIGHRPEDKRNFSLLLETLRARLDRLGAAHGGRHYLLSIAAADSEFVQGIELQRVSRSLDWINLMTYDFHNSLTPTTGHHAGLHLSDVAPAEDRAGDKAVAQFLAAGVPARKLNLGVAFYGRAFTGVDPAHDGLQQKYARYAGDPSWRELVASYIDKNGYVRHWDARAQAPYLWNAATRSFVSYEDPQSLRAKVDFVKAKGLGGVMYWEHGLDRDEELLGVLDEALGRH
ncbi:glycoside hydrolase family 18 protein [Dyella soli]|uniref:chitinase n=1 Tax=Dyella soli TaxID=522319 RepID=A0A4R0YM77_9GAMM|nr:glycoside hydrolase family 18 protein [Dyella soli]TCI09979.1 glycoside hydrolase family 18 protein [Dyella soli]